MSDLEKQLNLLKYYICEMCYLANSGHPSSSLSCSDIIGTLYFEIMDISKDKFILSKGHAVPALYSALMVNNTISKDLINKLREIDSPLQGHPDVSRLPEVELTTGALGQGLSFGIGVSLAKRLKKEQGQVYVLVGDGEIQEGQIWEAVMFAGNRNLRNLILFLDNNGGQSDGKVSEIMSLDPLREKFEAFGWDVDEINGHDSNAIMNTVKSHLDSDSNKPLFVNSNTTKGFINKDTKILDGSHGGVVDEETMSLVISKLDIKESI